MCFSENSSEFLDLVKGSNFYCHGVSNGIIQKRPFRPIHDILLTKNQKLLNVGKIREPDVQRAFFFRG